ncbi:hypothetical protein NRA58_13270 [Acinetobacter baumannii]|uniref:hypothetical protein n=1 Tax=Acinetobacter baumannii TaxID=470 RepID=UPI00233F8479|nr:hypothetical protein [Acinetobacter baumannii]MDC4919649.1 hypothetical protein [Acinetobacter baumannii]MDC4934121.1 hypothetical protein [Acinetobacter baumannii]MDC5521377.1 hypothetical protein [Acinetobacter baumannii]
MFIIYERDFGAAVAQNLKEIVKECHIIPLGEFDAKKLKTKKIDFACIIITGRQAKKLKEVSLILTNEGIKHSTIVLSDDFLCCGPLIIPDSSPCMFCTVKRITSLVEKPRTMKQDIAFHSYLEKNSNVDLKGYLPPLVEIASLKILQHSKCAHKHLGKVTIISLINGRMLESRIIPLHGCSCRQNKFSTIEERWTKHLISDLDKILT